MNVYFSTSTRTLSENIEECRAILDTIKQNGHHVTMDWIDEAYERISRHDKLSTEKYPELYEENLHALNVSDVVIIEASANTFNSGYLSGKAINLQKPLLVLTRDYINKPTFISGEFTSNKQVSTYDSIESLKKITSEFLEDNSGDTNAVRFNMYIGRNISNYLKRASKEQGKTKAQIVRDIITEYMINHR